MKEQLVTFETAKLAKEKRFDYKVRSHYHGFANQQCFHKNNFDWNNGVEYLSAPTQSLLQKWLREVKGIDVEIRICSELYRTLYKQGRGKKCLKYYLVIIPEPGIDYSIDDGGFTSDSFEEALEKGLIEALKLI